MEVAEGGQDETALGDVYDVVEELAIVRSEGEDETVSVEFWRQRSECGDVKVARGSLSQTNEMIREDPYGTQARCVYEITPDGERHDRESEARQC